MTGAGTAGCGAGAAAGAAAGTTATTVWAGLGLAAVGAGAVWAAGVPAATGADATTGVVALCASTAPKTATQTTMASAQAAAANRILRPPQGSTQARLIAHLRKQFPCKSR